MGGGEGADDQILCLVLLGGLPSGLEKDTRGMIT